MKVSEAAFLVAVVGAASMVQADDPTDPELARWSSQTVVDGSRDGQARRMSIRDLNNCYNYALNRQTNTFAAPGRRAHADTWRAEYWAKLVRKNTFEDGKIPFFQPTDRDEFKQAMTEYGALVRKLAVDDGLTWVGGPDLKKPNEIVVGADEHVVALVVGYFGNTKKIDHHWYRRNKLANGQYIWSHKKGDAAPRITANDQTRLTTITRILKGNKANKDGRLNASRTYYDKFIGYFKVKSTVQINSGPDTGRVGAVEVSDLSGGTYAWCLNEPAEVAQIVRGYLTDLPETVDPQWDSYPEYRGMTLFVAPGLLTGADCDEDGRLSILDFVCFQQLFQAGDLGADLDGDGILTILDFVAFKMLFDQGLVDPGLWQVGEAATIQAFEGVIEVVTGFEETTTVRYYEDVFGLEQALLEQADDRGEIHPVCD